MYVNVSLNLLKNCHCHMAHDPQFFAEPVTQTCGAIAGEELLEFSYVNIAVGERFELISTCVAKAYVRKRIT